VTLSDSVVKPALAKSLESWQRAAGPFWLYVCAAPFLSPLAEAELAQPARKTRWSGAREIFSAVQEAQDQRTAVFVDLAPEQTLTLTAELNRLDYVVVPVIQRWAVANAAVPSELLVEALVRYGAQARLPHEHWDQIRGAVFLLDGLRRGRPMAQSATSPNTDGAHAAAISRRTSSTRRFNNRYTYPICRFPPSSLLRQLQFLAFATIPREPAPDLLPYYDLLETNGFVHLRPSRSPVMG
jgi:hypothetical protein